MIDVPAASWHPPVVENRSGPFGRPPFERLAHRGVAKLAGLERHLMLRRVGQPEQQAVEAQVSIADPGLPVRLASLVFAPGAPAGAATVDLGFFGVAGRLVRAMAVEDT